MAEQSHPRRPLHLYLHIPYCRSRCDYCSRRILLGNGSAHRAYAEALQKELEASAPDFTDSTVTTLVLGGGSPTALGPELFSSLLRRVRALFSVAEDAQVTVEVPQNGLTASWMTLFQNLGVNRLSIGLATGRDRECALLGLPSGTGSAETSLILPQMFHLPDYEATLLTGIPGQTRVTFAVSLKFAVRFHTPEITLLPLEQPLSSAWAAKAAALPPKPSAEETAAIYAFARAHLAEKGYQEYRPGRFAKPGFVNQNLLAKETEEDYLSIGPGTHSRTDGISYRTTPDLSLYLASSDDPAAIYLVSDAKRLSMRSI